MSYQCMLKNPRLVKSSQALCYGMPHNRIVVLAWKTPAILNMQQNASGWFLTSATRCSIFVPSRNLGGEKALFFLSSLRSADCFYDDSS